MQVTLPGLPQAWSSRIIHQQTDYDTFVALETVYDAVSTLNLNIYLFERDNVEF